MKPPVKRLGDLKPSSGQTPSAKTSSRQTGAYARPTPKVSRQKTAKVLTPQEKAAFLASRPDLKPKP